ncbi:site-specific integrase [Paenarthrobacter nitroguajacolicus]|uniref:Site-specific integrase n=1 Tax=Paenarthrobacter nitroguajacolicus TaxID=211146 RepID=A0A558GXL1_PAENT|nr:site-specific integrase [Paenarthrobacter nitroguajacolicus]TVU61614.1 site-specific integrase [Paenarthrobacter nitroguajacolicus]
MARVEDRWIRKDKKRSAEYGKGKRWRAVWTEPDGSEKKKSFTNKDAAKTHAALMEAEIQNGTYQSLNSGTLTVAEWAEVWFIAQVHQRAGSLDQIRRRLDLNIIPTLGKIPLRDLTRADIQAAIAVWGRTLAPSTIKLAYVYLSGLLKAAVLDDHLKRSPTVGVRLPRVEHAPVRPLDVQQVQRLVGVIRPAQREAVVFAAATGLRPSELFGLTWDRIDLESGVVTIDRQLITGGDIPNFGPLKTQASYRSVKIGSASILMLKGRGQQHPESLVFTNAIGGGMSRNTRSEVWTEARKILPFIGDGWHQLRHHHASLLISAGLSPVAVAHRLGHKDATETLQTYAHLWPNDDERMVAASDGLVILPEQKLPENSLGAEVA